MTHFQAPRGSGGAPKRGRGGAIIEKEEAVANTIAAARAQLVLAGEALGQQHQGCASVRNALGRASRTCCSDTVRRLPADLVTTLKERLAASKNIDAKTHTISKAFFTGERQQLSTLERGKAALINMRAGAFDLTCQALLYSEFMSEAGVMNWDAMETMVIEIDKDNTFEHGRNEGAREAREEAGIMADVPFFRFAFFPFDLPPLV